MLKELNVNLIFLFKNRLIFDGKGQISRVFSPYIISRLVETISLRRLNSYFTSERNVCFYIYYQSRCLLLILYTTPQYQYP